MFYGGSYCSSFPRTVLIDHLDTILAGHFGGLVFGVSFDYENILVALFLDFLKDIRLCPQPHPASV